MPEKKHQETQEEQSARFIADAQRLVDDGELSLTEADKAVEEMLSKQKRHPPFKT
ncbi:hypothetical protein GCM10011395_16690 [Sphingomonas psychrolutea]|uniref:Antitoxin VbhA domain-containing protein n=1 Tax=Sphingomonas psychrolutea TaxID=1259676 RepID=A0ABQ1GNT4_9SPHN|nr:hypothetical protein GCM10011395_16690 [Sphingomonas psychrolutea]